MVDKAELVGQTPVRIMLVGPSTEQGTKDAEQLMKDLQGNHRALLPQGWTVERIASTSTQLREPPSGTPDPSAVRSSVQLEEDTKRQQQEQQKRQQQQEEQRKQQAQK